MHKSPKASILMLIECVKMSIANIFSNRLRSFLTVLGILIGVSAVIALITTVSGVSGSLTSSFSSMGAGTLVVSVSGSDLKEGLSANDIEEITAIEDVDGVTPNVSLMGRVSRGDHYKSRVSVSGKNSYYFQNTEDLIVRGRNLNVIDENSMSYVCWIDQDMIDEFFYGIDPIGEKLYISGISYLVVGIYDADKASNISSMMSGSADILIPYTTALKMNNSNVITSFIAYLADGVDSETASGNIESVMDAMFSYEEDCFEITTMSSVEDTMKSMLSMMAALLAGIASIALVVGGIGIMNMMLTSVSERTVEIGLKKSLGALPWQIQIQFLIESFLLSMIGGIAGVGVGLLLSLVLCKVLDTEFVISVGAIILGTGFSAAVGILFGWAPARKASKLNPIDALRSV